MPARSLFTAIVTLAVGGRAAIAQAVSSTGGNICLASRPSRDCKRLTNSGLDRDPGISNDGRFVVFVRGTPGDSTETPTGDRVEATELWIVDVADGQLRRLLRGGTRTEGSGAMIGPFKSPQFSPNGSRVYFLSSAAVVSDAVYAVDVATRKAGRFVPGIRWLS
jgi:Tol biopolymer transport system component